MVPPFHRYCTAERDKHDISEMFFQERLLFYNLGRDYKTHFMNKSEGARVKTKEYNKRKRGVTPMDKYSLLRKRIEKYTEIAREKGTYIPPKIKQ